MSDTQNKALGLVTDAISRYIDLPPEGLQMSSVLKDIGVDSLTLAEMLFELEDRLGQPIPDQATPPVTVNDIVTLLQPYVQEAGA